MRHLFTSKQIWTTWKGNVQAARKSKLPERIQRPKIQGGGWCCHYSGFPSVYKWMDKMIQCLSPLCTSVNETEPVFGGMGHENGNRYKHGTSWKGQRWTRDSVISRCRNHGLYWSPGDHEAEARTTIATRVHGKWKGAIRRKKPRRILWSQR